MKSTSGVLLSNGKVYEIKTGMDDSDKFDRIPDEELLTLVQKQTFKYFWNFGHEHSGMARERTTSADVVTTGGTGFGVMAMLVAAERGFVTRQEALGRVQKIVTFLDEECTSYHGAYSHWINGSTGKTQPFGDKDDGADLVETSLLFPGTTGSPCLLQRSFGSREQVAFRHHPPVGSHRMDLVPEKRGISALLALES